MRTNQQSINILTANPSAVKADRMRTFLMVVDFILFDSFFTHILDQTDLSVSRQTGDIQKVGEEM
jgi:hypothetical protein